MLTINNVHEQFASFFEGEKLKPFAYLVSKLLSEGHICLNLNDIINQEIEFPVLYKSLQELEEDLRTEKLVGSSFDENQPFILYNSRFYIQRYFVYESVILKKIKRFLEREKEEMAQRKEALLTQRDMIADLFDNQEPLDHLSLEEQIDWQQIACILAALNNFTIITGGPGTGKTTTTARLLTILRKLNPDLTIGLAAPTGKAAGRLSESLNGQEATTIHRLLKTIPNTHRFFYNEDNPLHFDVVIVDEASMVDVALFAKLLSAIDDDTRLILLGDKDQLASVEAGSLFRDLCLSQSQSKPLTHTVADFVNSFIEDKQRALPASYCGEAGQSLLSNHIIELKRSRRFDSRQGIGKLSKAIINNDVDQIRYFIEERDSEQISIDTAYSEKIFHQAIEEYADFINEPDIKKAIEKFDCLRVLCAIREGEYGLYQINKKIEDFLSRRGLIQPLQEFYHNRPIIITRNYHNLELYNGDVGIIRHNEDGELMAYFDTGDNLKVVAPGLISQCETVFAMTIHKSQGSEYDKVLIVLPQIENINLLTRELLYTAITRAKKSVTIQANEATLYTTAHRQVRRASGIGERLKRGEQWD